MIKKYCDDLISLIYPDTCYNCDVPLVDGEQKICLRCYRDFPLVQYHDSADNPLLQVTSSLLKVAGAFCYMKFNKDGVAQKLLHELKYKGNTPIGLVLGNWFAKHIENELKSAEVDYIIPLPLHRKKKRQRGFNQSEVIAKGMEKILGIPVLTDVLLRTTNSATQTQKGKVERWQNVESLYEVRNTEVIAGKNIFLVDDVITTGATIGSALEALDTTAVNQLYFGCIASGK